MEWAYYAHFLFFSKYNLFQIFLEVDSIKPTDKKGENLINDQIEASYVLVIDENGTQLGKLPIEEALSIAYDRGYDLVCVAPNAEVPVCKLMDYSKYRYEQNKKAKEAIADKLTGNIVKEIYVPGKIINIVAK